MIDKRDLHHEVIPFDTLSEFENGEVCIKTGVVTALNFCAQSIDITSDDEGSLPDMEVFYHCQHTKTTLDGFLAFEVDDEILYVRYKENLQTKRKVIGFQDKLEYCDKWIIQFYFSGSGYTANPPKSTTMIPQIMLWDVLAQQPAVVFLIPTDETEAVEYSQWPIPLSDMPSPSWQSQLNAVEPGVTVREQSRSGFWANHSDIYQTDVEYGSPRNPTKWAYMDLNTVPGEDTWYQYYDDWNSESYYVKYFESDGVTLLGSSDDVHNQDSAIPTFNWTWRRQYINTLRSFESGVLGVTPDSTWFWHPPDYIYAGLYPVGGPVLTTSRSDFRSEFPNVDEIKVMVKDDPEFRHVVDHLSISQGSGYVFDPDGANQENYVYRTYLINNALTLTNKVFGTVIEQVGRTDAEMVVYRADELTLCKADVTTKGHVGGYGSDRIIYTEYDCPFSFYVMGITDNTMDGFFSAIYKYMWNGWSMGFRMYEWLVPADGVTPVDRFKP